MTTFKTNTEHRSYNCFTEAEAAVIVAHYPTGGVAGVQSAMAAAGMPPRKSANIRNYCHRHGIKFVGAGKAHADETQAAWVNAGADRLTELAAKPNRTNAEEVEMINREIETL